MRPYLKFCNCAPFTSAAVIAILFVLAVTAAIVREGSAAAEGANSVVTVNAASYLRQLSPGAIAAAFGANLATQSEAAQFLPLRTELAGTRVRLMDSRNNEFYAPLFFASSGQVNFLIPDEAALGAVRMAITNSNGITSSGEIELVSSSPAIFTRDSNGRGLPIALTTFDGINFDSVSSTDGSPKPVLPGSVWKPNYLTIFGTGLRYAKNLRIRIGGVEVEPLYSGAQGSFSGLDQVNVMIPSNLSTGTTDVIVTADGRASNIVQLQFQGESLAQASTLTTGDVQTIIAQAVGKAQQLGLKVTVAVTDREGTVIGVFRMTGAPATTRIGAFNLQTGVKLKPVDPDGLQDTDVPASFAAISKAGTASFFSTQGNAFSTRTASFIIQEHFPPLIQNTGGGPLFGVQFSQLPCSDIKIPNLPLGLAGDPGGVPIYKNGIAAGGVGIEGDGFYSIDIDPSDFDQSPEEIIAVAATQGFEAPADIRGDQILADGIRLPFVNAQASAVTAGAFASLPGTVDPSFPVRNAAASIFSPLTLAGVPGRIDSRFYPFKNSPSANPVKLNASEVNQIITQAAQQAFITRAAIRRPLGSRAEVNIAVVDAAGVVLGIFTTQDAPIFGFDVSVQKARTAAFFSNPTAGAQLRAAQGGRFIPYADAAAADGIKLDGTIAFSDRANGFLSRPFFPDGIDGSPHGPNSKPISVFSPFNNGLQVALVKSTLVNILSGLPFVPGGCTGIPALANGIQIFAGSVPLYKNGVLVGGIGISGDGIDQDDLIAAAGSIGFEAPPNIRADQFFVRGVRLPYVKFPRHPNLP